jgi:hypothetical protein
MRTTRRCTLWCESLETRVQLSSFGMPTITAVTYFNDPSVTKPPEVISPDDVISGMSFNPTNPTLGFTVTANLSTSPNPGTTIGGTSWTEYITSCG